MIIVTGGAGFIGSNIVKKLNSSGRDDILVVDNLSNGAKFRNLVDCRIADYMDKEDFLALLKCADGFPGSIDVVFHMGACSTTTEWDGRYMMRNNYEYSKELMHYCVDRNIQFIYASSAAVYGGGTDFREDPEVEHPLNIYGYSKLLFDQYVRRHLPEATSQIVGFRYFNVYGPGEQHKESMASVAFHFSNQLKQSGMLKLFEGTDGYAAGEQRRDFVYVDDVADVNLWFMQNSDVSGIFNLGTGRSQTFNDVARAAIAWHGEGKIEYVPFPGHLIGCYQSFTQADLTALRSAGYNGEFLTVEQGVKHYLDTLHAEPVVGP